MSLNMQIPIAIKCNFGNTGTFDRSHLNVRIKFLPKRPFNNLELNLKLPFCFYFEISIFIRTSIGELAN